MSNAKEAIKFPLRMADASALSATGPQSVTINKGKEKKAFAMTALNLLS